MSQEPSVLEVFSTDELIAEVIKRFDTCVFAGQFIPTDGDERVVVFYGGEFLKNLGLCEVIKHRLSSAAYSEGTHEDFLDVQPTGQSSESDLESGEDSFGR